MNAQPTALAASKNQNRSQESQSQEIDLLALLGALLDRKWFIVLVTAVFAIIGVAVAVLSTPIYKATALVQVEESSPSVPGLDDMAGMFESSSEAVTEIELLKSRSVIGEAVDTLKLDIIAEPKLLPIIGGKLFRSFVAESKGDIAEPFLGLSSYAWGGESINVFRFNIPKAFEGEEFELVIGENKTYELFNPEGDSVLKGVVGKEQAAGYYELTVRDLNARPGTEFTLIKKNRYRTIVELQQEIGASEKGKDSGIIAMGYEHKSAAHAAKVLDKVADIYVRRNVERNSAEAKKSLDFLEVQLPEVKRQLEQSEQRFNDYQKQRNSVNISLETQGVLEQIVELDTTLQELELKRLELSRKFKREHPAYQGVLQQIKAVETEKEQLTSKVGNLPETQQELLRLTRDVEVGNEIYMLLLSKTQELDIVRAGTVGNVRVVDAAAVDTTEPVKPKKALIAVVATLLGGFLAVAIVLTQKAMHRGVEDPTEIESIGLPVYASVPYSDFQDKLTGFNRARKVKDKPKSILAVDNPADLSVEALRSLRTSLHFAMMEAKNNIIAISGPSPGVGKSFISVNLATVLAQSGKKVLIIDADMRKGYLQTQFGMKWDDGLSDLLSGRLNLEQVTKKSQVEGLNVITRGQIPPNPSELLMHSNFSKMVAEVSGKYDIIIVDTPPILAVTDPAIVSAHAGSTLLVTRFGQNHLREIELTRNRFEQNGIDVKGVVFNGVVRKASNAYGYYGYYNYEYKSDK
ncbi:polysaccharide biosynthesis tyrosine autokinase [Pseudoalteromonas shioyasakiensis]|uniref:polysaccharide biosynthesis tyrosine autokinase n=1 Tax=Pseudoalteromonas shioyasakiensis TaxID=1190813 RepID=UPI0022B20891|nr:polysaccharide biosynthesis tyrosine autokinase [Pseudoalteromonas shioyasakiensis]MCZ4253851.1 polysaccharide biosynthesis tyrosine autokinase [Pseudoalteromonas shioyasakiensis]